MIYMFPLRFHAANVTQITCTVQGNYREDEVQLFSSSPSGGQFTVHQKHCMLVTAM
jgi:hypothetical protein